MDQFANFCKKSNWDFYVDYVESKDKFGEYCHVFNIKSANM